MISLINNIASGKNRLNQNKSSLKYNNTEDSVLIIVANVLCINKKCIQPYFNLINDLDVDSLDRDEIKTDLENQFDCFINENVSLHWQTIQDIFDYCNCLVTLTH